MLVVVLAVVTKLLLFCLLLLVALWCWYQLTHWKLLRAAAKLPTPYHPVPLFGHFIYSNFTIEDVSRWILETNEYVRSKGWNMNCYWAGPVPLVMLHDAELIQKVLRMSSTAEKLVETNLIHFFSGDGLLTARRKVWRVTRRHINPLFHPQNVEHMVPVFNRNSRQLVTALSEHVGGAPVNVFHPFMDTALQTVCHLMFGVSKEINVKSKDFRRLRNGLERISGLFTSRLLYVWLRIDAVFNLFYNREVKELKKAFSKFAEDPLKAVSLNHAEEAENTDTSETGSTPTRTQTNNGDGLNLIDVFKSLRKSFPNFTTKYLKDETNTLYVTGTDTVGLAVGSCLLALGYYPSIQERLLQEVLSVVGKDDDVTSQDLLRMPYLDQVYKETLRFFMIAPFIGRSVTEDITLGTHFLPAGSSIIMSLDGLSMNPKLFPNPKTFDPEHFSPENLKGKEEYYFIPFSAGPRDCIGKLYADNLVKIMIVHVLRRYQLSTKMDIYNMKKKISVLLVSSEGYNVSLNTRN